MLPLQFFGQNAQFAINLFAALVFFAVFWLYFDAWTTSHKSKGLIECGGFLLVALSFVVLSTVIEQPVFGKSLLGSVSQTIAASLQIVGFCGIIIGQLIDPLQKKPKTNGLQADDFSDDTKTKENSKLNTKKLAAVGFSGAANLLHLFLPFGALAIMVLYWRRATRGLEHHLKPVALSFLFLSGYEILSLTNLWTNSDNTVVAKLVAPFGILWMVQLMLLLIGSIILGLWVWHYLTRRFFSQMFMLFITLTLGIFLITTVSFTFLLVNNVQNESLSNLKTAANVLSYAINAKKAETLANASAIAENPSIISAVLAKNNQTLTNLTDTFLHDKTMSSLIITTANGQVMLRAEDPSDYGDSLSSNPLVRRALIGQSSSSIDGQAGVLAPSIYIDSSTPIWGTNNQIVGTVTVGLMVDNAFVDGIKQSTGLDSAVYAGNIVSATTFVEPDGVTRMVGVKDTNSSVETAVLKNGGSFDGSVSIYNLHYLADYIPLRDINNNIVGMLFIGVPQDSIIQTAGHSVELTFIVTAILLLLAIAPAYFIAKFIADQLN